MTGLELARQYYSEVGRPALLAACPGLEGHLAAGLVGEGSECLGFDDPISQDHDWGPGFCVWLSEADYTAFGKQAAAAYAALPGSYQGHARLRSCEMSAGRVGVFSIGQFYGRFLQRTTPPQTNWEWLALPDQALNVCTNGIVFEDQPGNFTQFRQALLAYYPEDVRRKHLAARCALAAQSGQYNYTRCLRRGERVAALRALAEFIDHAQAAFFLLERQYRPYYKWAHRALAALPCRGAQAAPLFEALEAADDTGRTQLIETISAMLIDALRNAGLSDSASDFLLPHAEQVQNRIQDMQIRSIPLMACP